MGCVRRDGWRKAMQGSPAETRDPAPPRGGAAVRAMQPTGGMKTSQEQAGRRGRGGASVRVVLAIVLAFSALMAFGGAYYGLAGAEGVPREWLDGSPFRDYTVPSLFLGVVVGGAFAIAAIAVAARLSAARLLALAAGAIVLAWLAAQLAIIGYVSWMQPVTAATAVLILVLAWRMQRGARSDRAARAAGPASTAAHALSK